MSDQAPQILVSPAESCAGWQGKSRHVVERCRDLSNAAALLAVGALLWRCVHPSSHQLMQAMVVALNLSSGYASTKRRAALGRIAAGSAPVILKLPVLA